MYLFQARPQTQTIRRTDGTTSRVSTSSSTKRLMGKLNVQLMLKFVFCSHYVLSHNPAWIFGSSSVFRGGRLLLEVTLMQLCCLRKSCSTAMLRSLLLTCTISARGRKNSAAPFPLFTLFNINIL